MANNQKKVTAWNTQVNEVNEGRRQEEWQRHQSPTGNEIENKINAQGYVEMDYFTLRGCSLAKENSSAMGTDALGLININANIKGINDIWKDHKLTWSEVNQARHMMMKYIMKNKDDVWPKSHPIREEENGDEALVIYHARAWKEWHDRLAKKEGMNLAIINEDLLTNIQLKLVTKRAADTAKESGAIADRDPKKEKGQRAVSISISKKEAHEIWGVRAQEEEPIKITPC
ncbi:hypothetical protein BDQ17DRAFT_1325722 [Cyathus striatus]|nr:hypothetical protein BDQ17DRAFT_1325722 [Cyathus striatus]